MFERNTINSIILHTFHSKEIATEPLAKLIIPSLTTDLMTNFKTYLENDKNNQPENPPKKTSKRYVLHGNVHPYYGATRGIKG